MKRTLISFAVLGTILAAAGAQAGGWDRSGQDTSIILKEGSLLEITSVTVAPKITGTYTTTKTTGSVAPDYSFINIGFRTDISDKFSLAVIQDSPFGADVNWTTTGDAYSGTKATIKTSATTVLVSYDIDNVTVYGGLKNQSFNAEAEVPAAGYTIKSDTDQSLGYVFGAAVERPEIAMRVALTYHSKVSHDVSIVETTGGATTHPATILSAKTPESFNLDFQTGVAENTLLFGTIRQVMWTQTLLDPPQYPASTPLKEFTQDTISYTLGLGRKFSDQWSGAVTYGTEAAEGIVGSALGPTDGYSKMGVGVTYSGEHANITLGVQQINNGGIAMKSATMADNTTFVTAVKIAYKF